MRWKLLRRRLSVSAPRVTVRSRLPWPLRWMGVALALGFSAALALWAYEFGKDIAGLDRGAQQERQQLREQLAALRVEHERALSIANSADTLLKTERAAQESLAARLRSLEAENLALTRDLGMLEKLLPSGGVNKRLVLRGLQAQSEAPGRLRYQALLMPAAGRSGEFKGRYSVSLSGTLEGKPWSGPAEGASGQSGTFSMAQYHRLEGVLAHDPRVQVKQLELKVFDATGVLQTTENLRF